ncbi:NtaA/DmoA family FMN-dependent monooxygenase [Amycolatopsis rubida]|uniref:NtaA/DmoA family FMN-dependent monooxygenase n=1 Tax=Amycolatopsis rubida TaxID=112413 RepID=A0ABX0C3L8_9PSEU|nr:MULTISPECIES: NtaA/DmoA family FMN-dependent monooxygenase [Amycolatopsis]MYW96176.1 NtaA/DmoA family FMN-dependent monooxygenase [Amycolatopsis rubida]NEC61167.1 NtaA/DmoA family FMN-dependent monooxygenase [Amycolatopsis rubida]OAP24308.1 Nitrilotriacetate monooxygenase component A [Amycolatopsis sp. M39]
MRGSDEVMNLVLFLAPTGRAGSAWRSPSSGVEELWGLDLPLRITQQAERAKFDAVFVANVLFTSEGGIGKEPFSTGYEPFTLMAALAARTERIGLIGTASTTFVHPFNMARSLGSLDWLSGGRIGWNVVTSSAGAEHFGFELPPKEERYARAQEYLELTTALWDAFDDDAVVNDRENAVWARSDRIHPVDFKGEYFQVRGQLFMHRTPQGRPVIVQAGQSAAGMDFAARNAEVIFTAQTDLDRAREFYREIKERAATIGRDPASVRILPGVLPIAEPTAAAAREVERELDGYVDWEAGLKDAAVALQADLTGLDPDQPIPPGLLAAPEAASVDALGGSRYHNYYDMAVRQKLTLRQVVARLDRALGHLYLAGSVGEVADHLQEWFESRACDGFAITPATVPEGMDSVCEVLLPELRRRNLVRTEYNGATLRDHLGLARPAPLRER